MEQQRQMRDAFVGFAHHISSTAQDLNATWPMVRVPNYELHAGQVRLQSGAEIIAFSAFVEQNDEDEYLDFVTTNYEDNLKEGHLIRYGNLDRLIPVGYTPNFTIVGPNGFTPDTIDRTIRKPLWHLSPRKSCSVSHETFQTIITS